MARTSPGRFEGGALEVLAAQALPHSLGLLYEELTAHLGFRRSSDEYKVMAMASYGEPAYLEDLRSLVYADGVGGFRVEPFSFTEFAPPLRPGGEFSAAHAALACSVQRRLEEVLLELARWLHRRTGHDDLVLAGGVALNCVANSRIWREGPFARVWVQPASGDSGTALGAALQVAHELGDRVAPMRTAALGPGWDDEALAAALSTAGLVFEEPDDIADAVAEVLADNGVVAWFEGRSEFGPRALGHRSLLADPRRPENLEKLNDIKGREQFRPIAPMVLAERATEIFRDGPIPSPFMLFTHGVRDAWRERIPAVVHVDGTARIQTVDRASEPLVARMLECFEARTGVPVVVNTSLNTAGRPMVDSPRDALECFGSCPVDALAIGPFLPAPQRRGGGLAHARGGGVRYQIVIPTSGRASLATLLDAIGPSGVIVVDDRRDRSQPLLAEPRDVVVVPGPGAGPGGRAQRRLAGGARRVGRVPRRRRRAAARLARAARGRPRVRGSGRRGDAGPDRRARAGAADGLGAQRRRARARAVGDRGHGLPARRAGGGRRLRRALPARLPRGR